MLLSNTIHISGPDVFDVTGSWQSVEFVVDATSTSFQLRIADASNNIFLDSDGDTLYLKNIVMAQVEADGHVVTWYDQSGNSNNAVQSTASGQPKIVTAGVVEKLNSKPCVTFTGVTNNHFLDASSSIPDSFTDNGAYTNFEVAAVDNSTEIGGILCGNVGYRGFFQNPSATYRYGDFHNPNGLTLVNTLNMDETSQFVMTASFDKSVTNGTYSLYGNSSLEKSESNEGSSNLANPTTVYIGRDPSGGSTGYLASKIQEIVFYNSNQLSIRTDIETEINDFYGAY